MSLHEYLKRFAAPEEPIPPNHYRCRMCLEIFEKTRPDGEVAMEALTKGISQADIDDETNLVCDDCYKKTPWGSDAEVN